LERRSKKLIPVYFRRIGFDLDLLVKGNSTINIFQKRKNMCAPANALPARDEYTAYDYEVGKDRLDAVANKKYEIKYLSREVQALAFERVLNNPHNVELRLAVSNGQCNRGAALNPQLEITYWKNDKAIKKQVNALSLSKTQELTGTIVARWGNDAEKLLSASETGALYWNIIHHFGAFERVLK
jgi:hypothetical protein